MKAKLLVYLLLAPLFAFAQQQERLLNTESWTFRKAGDASWLPATVPGTVHTDLLHNKLIPDPFVGDNEKKVQWIENESWEYQAVFNVTAKELEQKHVELQLEGLDTYAKVYLNNTLIITADNMFRSWNADVKKNIHSGSNTLLIVFESAVKKGKAAAAKLNYTLPGDEKVFTRKAQYQYGWDWGPRLVTCGIWKDVKLICWSNAKINTIYCVQKKLTDTQADLEFICDITSDKEQEIEMVATAPGTPSNITYTSTSSLHTTKTKKEVQLHLPYTIYNPRKWWTNGLGDPYLYYFKLALSADGKQLETKQLNIGLRTLELVQEKDSVGSSFYFRLNGVPVFMKGANYIPPDNFLPQTTKKQYETTVANAVAANMNMLRVWGGGVYADDAFYDACDRNGILVWQDFMFACAMYPGTPDFIQNAGEEVKEQVQRLRNHPCIALWCGNNEVDEGWHNWGWQKQYNYSFNDSARIADDYEFFFEHLTLDIIRAHDPQRTTNYIPSSPSIGWGHKESLQQGDSHYWGVWWGNEPFEIYKQKVGRFMSEYGFQSMPQLSTFRKIANDTDLNFNSAAVKAHQKHPTGYQTIQSYLERDYRTPKDFENYSYVSQVLQAEGMKTAIEAHRRAKPYCMGTLYWQLNDCWPVTSWSSVDYYNNWKAAHYQAKHSFEPLIVSMDASADSLFVWVVSDKPDPVAGTLKVTTTDLEGKTISEQEFKITVAANASVLFCKFKISKLVADADKNNRVVTATFSNEQISYSDHFYFVKPKDLQLQIPNIKISRCDNDEREDCFTLTTDVLAKDVFITIGGQQLNLEDNFFDLLPGTIKTIRMPTGSNTNDLFKHIIIKSLADTY